MQFVVQNAGLLAESAKPLCAKEQGSTDDYGYDSKGTSVDTFSNNLAQCKIMHAPAWLILITKITHNASASSVTHLKTLAHPFHLRLAEMADVEGDSQQSLKQIITENTFLLEPADYGKVLFLFLCYNV